MSVAAIILAASLTLPAPPAQVQDFIQDGNAPLTYRATRRDRASGAFPEIQLTCAGREMHFRVSGLNLPATGETPMQAQIGSWSLPLYRPDAARPTLIAPASPALLHAIGGRSQMVLRVNRKSYRLQPVNSGQHAAFVSACRLGGPASIGPNPPQQLRPEERLVD